jgi:hypothetical protein
LPVLYILAALFLALWIAGALIHVAYVIVGTIFHYALWIAVVLFVAGYIQSRNRR